MWYRILQGLAAISVCLAAPALAIPLCPKIDAEAIVNFNEPPRSYRIIRGGRSLRIALFSELQAKDEIRVLTPTARLVLQTRSQNLLTLTAKSGRKCVRDRSRANWLTTYVLGLGGQVARRRSGDASLLDDLVSRGDEALRLGPDDLARGTATISSDIHALAFGWTGGTAPFLVEMRDAEGRAIVSEHNVEHDLLLLSRRFDLRPGHYDVSIKDAKGQKATGRLTVITGKGATRPAPSADAAIAQVARSLTRDPDRQFEAFVRLGPFRRADLNVRILMDLISLLPKSDVEATHDE